MAEKIITRLKERMGGAVLASHSRLGNDTVQVEPRALVQVATFLRDDPALHMNLPVDCTAVDNLPHGPPPEARFEVVWHLYAMGLGHRLRLKVLLGGEAPSCRSLTPLWPGFNWHEREAFDLYGIRFAGHPNLKRILMYEEFVGHPLRKDYPIDGRQPLIPMREISREVPTQRQPPQDMLNRP